MVALVEVVPVAQVVVKLVVEVVVLVRGRN